MHHYLCRGPALHHSNILYVDPRTNVLADWESIVNEVAKAVVGEKLIVCGRAARWWDAEVKAKIEHRRDVYRKIAGGQDELWEEY